MLIYIIECAIIFLVSFFLFNGLYLLAFKPSEKKDFVACGILAFLASAYEVIIFMDR